jgi:tetratricopeptide (TPR) repeat protein
MRVPERATVLRAAGSMSMFQGEIAAAASLLERAVELARVVGDKETLARSLTFLAWVRVVHGLDLERSTALGEEGVMVARNLGDAWVLAEALNTLGAAYGDQSYSPRSVSLLEESLQLRRSIEDIAGITDSLNNLGYLSVLGEDYPKAVAYLEESLELARRSADRPHIILAQDNLALAYLFDGEPALAEELFGETLRMCHEIGDKRIAEEALMGLAGVAALRHEWARAAWLAGASSGLAAVNELLPNDAETKIDEHYLSDARRALGDEVYKAEFEDGQRSSLEEAVAHALDETASA